jgi:hypothetical protein
MLTDRKNRGKTQKLYLIESYPSTSNFEREYAVMGSTGNVYLVKIKSVPTCTCPDYLERLKRCKHIYFILIRVMGIQDDETDKDNYISGELTNMFSNISPVTNNLVADHKYIDIYEKNKDKILPDKHKLEEKDQKKTDDLCPICLDDLENGEELVFCKYSCGKSIHYECFNMLAKSRNISCPFCMKTWDGSHVSFKYVNLLY